MATTESEANAAVAMAEAGSDSAGSVASAAESAESEGIESADPVDAEELKAAGNALYSEGHYAAAIDKYSEAIEAAPTEAKYYGNRAAAYMKLGQWRRAIQDSEAAIEMDETFTKGYLRAAACYLQQGRWTKARLMYASALEIEPNNANAADDLQKLDRISRELDAGNAHLEGRNFRAAFTCFGAALRDAPDALELRTKKAECQVGMRQFQQASRLAGDVLADDPNYVDALFVRGLALYNMNNTDQAMRHFRKAMQVDPDNRRSMLMVKKLRKLERFKTEGNDHFKSGEYQEAYDAYSAGLEVDPDNVNVNSKLFCNRAAAAIKMGLLEDAVADCTAAIELDDGYLKAYMRRASVYTTLEQHDKAVYDYEKCKQLDPSNRELAGLLRQAKLELKKANRKDYYKILGISKTASSSEIKKAYKKKAFQWHPDKNNGSEEERSNAELMFKDVGEAYAVLSDDTKKRRYDQGADLQEIEQGGGFGGGGFHGHDIDPNMIFEMFMGGGGGGRRSRGGFGGFGF